MESLAGIYGIEIFCYAPENIGVDGRHFYKYDLGTSYKSFIIYAKWTKCIRRLVKIWNIDIVHILDGDSIMRFFSYGLTGSRMTKFVITYHHFFSMKMHKLSYKITARGRNKFIVVHTAGVKHKLMDYNITNVKVIKYPAFSFDILEGKNNIACKKLFGLPQEIPTIGIIGVMYHYKNILPFLEAMRNCSVPFHLLICGMEGDVKKQDILKATKSYCKNVTLKTEYISEEEYIGAIAASDIIFCIYGLDFDGASGPMTDGICANKMILSCSHGSLGRIVKENHLGITADCKNEKEILKQTEWALGNIKSFQYDKAARAYREQLRPRAFQKEYEKIYFGGI